MHVAVDAHNLIADNRGIGRYARAVLSRALREPGITWTLVVRRFFPNSAGLAAAVGGAPFRIARTVPRDADVVWFPWNGTFLETTAPSVATIHDCTPFAYPASDPQRRATEQGPFERTAATAVRIMTQSQYTATEVQRWLGVDPARITVTPLAADAGFTPGALDALPPAVRERPFVLCVGAHDERKNTPTLIDAFARAFAAGEMTLVFTRAPKTLPRDAIVVDARDDRTLVALYRAATIVAAPSLYEGFGLPVLEGMACGAPVLAARAGSLPEVGGDAARYVDEPDSVHAWRTALLALAGDAELRAELALRGPVHAARFSWDRCADETLEVVKSARA